MVLTTRKWWFWRKRQEAWWNGEKVRIRGGGSFIKRKFLLNRTRTYRLILLIDSANHFPLFKVLGNAPNNKVLDDVPCEATRCGTTFFHMQSTPAMAKRKKFFHSVVIKSEFAKEKNSANSLLRVDNDSQAKHSRLEVDAVNLLTPARCRTLRTAAPHEVITRALYGINWYKVKVSCTRKNTRKWYFCMTTLNHILLRLSKIPGHTEMEDPAYLILRILQI